MRRVIFAGIGVGMVVSASAAVGVVVALRSGSAQPDPAISPFQQALIAKGDVTQDKYLEAARATAACMGEQSIAATVSAPDPSGAVHLEYGPFDSQSEAQHAGDVYRGCYESHWSAVDRLWQQLPGHQAIALDAGQQVLACTEAAGGMRFSDNQEELLRQVIDLDRSGDAAFRDCWLQHGAGLASIAYTPLLRP